MIYVHRKALFLDTSANKARHWTELKAINEYNFANLNNPVDSEMIPQDTEEATVEGVEAPPIKYDRCLFEFENAADVVDYWRRLLHVSMHTFKFNVQSYLHENKRIRQDLLNKILLKSELTDIKDLWPIEEFGDQMGPGGTYSNITRLFIRVWSL